MKNGKNKQSSKRSVAILLIVFCVVTVAAVMAGVLSGAAKKKVSEQSETSVQQETQKKPLNKKPVNKKPKKDTQKKDDKQEDKQAEHDRLAKEFAEEKEEYYLLLANPDHALPQDFVPQTEIVQNSFKMDSRVAPATREMIDAAKKDGVDLLVCSAYRSIDKQITLFNNMKQDYIAQGMSEEEAYAKTATAIAVPGTSEHHTGLAADIVTPNHQTLDPEFADTPAGKWLNTHAHEYGFVLRYPEDKQDVTKIMYESWHFRFVGKTHAKLMKESGMCLEEYLEQEVPEGYTGKKDPYDEP